MRQARQEQLRQEQAAWNRRLAGVQMELPTRQRSAMLQAGGLAAVCVQIYAPRVAVADAPDDPVAAALAEPVEAEILGWLVQAEQRYAQGLQAEQQQLAAAAEAFLPVNVEDG